MKTMNSSKEFPVSTSLEYLLNKGGLMLDPATKLKLMDRKNAHYLELARNY